MKIKSVCPTCHSVAHISIKVHHVAHEAPKIDVVEAWKAGAKQFEGLTLQQKVLKIADMYGRSERSIWRWKQEAQIAELAGLTSGEKVDQSLVVVEENV